MGKVSWTILNQVTSSNYPIIQVYGVLYEPGELIDNVNTSMIRGQTITGGGTTTGTATNVTNDNNPLTPSNVFIEASPSGAVGSTVSIATDGTVTIKGDVANVLTTLLQLLPGAAAGASSVILGDAARQVEIAGSLLIDGNLNGNVTQGDVGKLLHALGDEKVDGLLTVIGDVLGNTFTANQQAILAGFTSGTLTVTVLSKFPIILLGQYSNFRNAGASDQFLTLPVAFNAGLAFAFIGDDVPGWAYANGGVKGGSGQILTGLASGGGSLNNTGAGYHPSLAFSLLNLTNNIRTLISGGSLATPFNQIEQSSGNASAHNGFWLIIGA